MTAATAPIRLDVNYLRSPLVANLKRVAREPHDRYRYRRGPEYAQDFLGYDRRELAALARVSSKRFARVGNSLAIGPIRPGSTLLDHARGGGMLNDEVENCVLRIAPGIRCESSSPRRDGHVGVRTGAGTISAQRHLCRPF